MEDLQIAAVLVPVNDMGGVEGRMEDVVGIQVGKSATGEDPSATDKLVIDDGVHGGNDEVVVSEDLADG